MTSKTVLITGASRRIGAVIARYLHAKQFDVVIHYNQSVAEANSLADELNQGRTSSASLVQADLSKQSSCDTLIDTVTELNNGLYALVNNASTFYPTLLSDVNEDTWDEIMDVNLKAPLFLAKRTAALLRKSQGCIVNITDIHGAQPLKRYPLYSVAKSGLIMLTRALAKELAPDVRVNAVSPGAILWPDDMDSELKNKILSRIPLRRHGDPIDIAKAVHFLITDADYITGQVLTVDGGRSLYD